MDLQALLAPLIRPLVSSSSSSGGSFGSNQPAGSAAALDRTLGAAATVGVSLAIYRLVSAALKDRAREGRSAAEEGGEAPASSSSSGGKAAGILALPTFLLSFLRIILQGAIYRRIEDYAFGGGGDAYHRAAHGAAATSSAGRGGGGPEVQHCGSCHCGSIRFSLKAPRRIHALDCKGKIRYPHYRTTADKFQLTKGSRHLKMYYVTVPGPSAPSFDDDRGHHSGAEMTEKRTMAAHTFCGRCGVNILRAPDSTSDALEVNVGCLETDDGTSVEVSYYDGGEATAGLGAGIPLQGQWTANDENATQFGDDATCTPLHVDDISTFWPTEPNPLPAAALSTPPSSSYSHPNSGKAALSASGGGMPDTPSTSATTMSDSQTLQPPSRVIVSHHHRLSSSETDMESSVDYDSTEDLTVSVGGGLDVIGEGTSMTMRNGSGGRPGELEPSSWAVGVGTSLHPSPREAALPPRPTTVNRDQLKYFMRRHLNTPSPQSSSVSDGK